MKEAREEDLKNGCSYKPSILKGCSLRKKTYNLIQHQSACGDISKRWLSKSKQDKDGRSRTLARYKRCKASLARFYGMTAVYIKLATLARAKPIYVKRNR